MLPGLPSLAGYDGALFDYSPKVDATRERGAAGANNAFNDVAMMGLTAVRAWVNLTPNGAGTPTLNSHQAMWGTGPSVAPVPAHAATGKVTITWPTTVSDQIQNGLPGYNGAITLNLRASWVNSNANTGTGLIVTSAITAANQVTVYFYNGGIATDSGGIGYDVFVI